MKIKEIFCKDNSNISIDKFDDIKKDFIDFKDNAEEKQFALRMDNCVLICNGFFKNDIFYFTHKETFKLLGKSFSFSNLIKETFFYDYSEIFYKDDEIFIIKRYEDDLLNCSSENPSVKMFLKNNKTKYSWHFKGANLYSRVSLFCKKNNLDENNLSKDEVKFILVNFK